MKKSRIKSHLIKTFRNYVSGHASPEEKRFVDEYYELFDKTGPKPKLTDKDLLEFEQEMQANILAKTRSNRNSFLSIFIAWPQIAAAAILVVAVTAGTLFFLNNKKAGKDSPKLSSTVIPPGTNKAVLTLANGNKIILSGTATGTIANQNGVAVNIAANGLIIYDLSKIGNNLPGEVSYNTISTPRGGKYEVLLADGTKIFLNAASSIKYPVSFNGLSKRAVELTGEGYFEVAKDKARPFEVTALGQRVEVLGTHFNINAYPDEQFTATTLLEGTVKITSGPNTSMLVPGQQSRTTQALNRIVVSNSIDLDLVMAWKNDEFHFNATDLHSIMRQFSRWYDVDVEYIGEVPNYQLSGTFSRGLNADEALKILTYTGLKFNIEGRKIIVR
jgi:transmembrane sensor